MIRSWAAQKKRATTGVRRFGDGTVHQDGWAANSSAAMVSDGRITGGSGIAGQCFAEVYRGDALKIWRVYQTAPPEIRQILHAHFIATGPVPRKARELGISVAAYWNRLNMAYAYLVGRLDRLDDGRSVITESR